MIRQILLASAVALASVSAVAAPVSYKIDPTHTDVLVSWNHFGFSNPSAHFGQVDGTIVFDEANPAASSVEVTMPLTGLNSHVVKFDEHLRSDDFLDAAKFPTITFKSSKVEKAAGDKAYTVTGELTLHGVTKTVVLATTLNGSGPHPMKKKPTIGFDATTTLKRSEFGIGKYVPNVSDELEVRITTEAIAP